MAPARGHATRYSGKIIHGFAVIMGSLLVSVLVSYLIRIFLARNLSLHDFGLFYAVFTFIVFLSFFRDIGLGNALAKFIPEFQVKKRFDRIRSSITVAYVIEAVVAVAIISAIFFLAPYLAQHYFRDVLSAGLLRLLSFMLLLLVLDDTLKKIFLGFQKMQFFSFIELGKNIAVFGLIVLLVSKGVGGVATAYLVASPLIFFIFLPFFFSTFAFFRRRLVITASLVKRLLRFGLSTILIGLGDRIISYMDILLLTAFVSLDQVGIYSAVIPTALLFLFLSRALSLVLYPLSSEMWAKKEERRQLSGIVQVIQRFSLLLLIPFVVLMFFFADLFISLFFGNDFVSGAAALRIILVGILFYSVAKINFSTISGAGFPGRASRMILIAAAINVVANLILIPRFALVGAAIGTSLSYLAAFLLSNRAIRRLLGSRFGAAVSVKIFLAGLVSLLVLVLASEVLALPLPLSLSLSLSLPLSLSVPLLLEVVLLCAITIAVYGTAVLLLNVISLKEITSLVKKFSLRGLVRH